MLCVFSVACSAQAEGKRFFSLNQIGASKQTAGFIQQKQFFGLNHYKAVSGGAVLKATALKADKAETESGESVQLASLIEPGNIADIPRNTAVRRFMPEMPSDRERKKPVDHDEAATDAEYRWPLPEAQSVRISSGYGYRKDPFHRHQAFHNGIDISAKPGTSVLAAADGVVDGTGRQQRLGNFVRLRHADGSMTIYGHLAKIMAREGEKIGSGDVIGRVGSTGRSTGPHLHFTVKKEGETVNPLAHLSVPASMKTVEVAERSH